MKYKEWGFRVLYHRFVGIKLNDEQKELIKGFPGVEDADCAIAYGYIDHEAGFSFDVLTVANIVSDGNLIVNTDRNNDLRLFFRAEAIKECEIFCLSDWTEELLAEIHKEKINLIHEYYESDVLDELRSIDYIDECRDPYYIDIIKVILAKDEMKHEICWVRLEGLTDNSLVATLLDEPHQNLGCHANDTIHVYIHETEEGKKIAYSFCD